MTVKEIITPAVEPNASWPTVASVIERLENTITPLVNSNPWLVDRLRGIVADLRVSAPPAAGERERALLRAETLRESARVCERVIEGARILDIEWNGTGQLSAAFVSGLLVAGFEGEAEKIERDQRARDGLAELRAASPPAPAADSPRHYYDWSWAGSTTPAAESPADPPVIVWKDGHCWFWPLTGVVVPFSEGEHAIYESGLADGRATAESEQRDMRAEIEARIGALRRERVRSRADQHHNAAIDAALAAVREGEK